MQGGIIKSICFFTFCFISIHSYAQDINFEWNKLLGTTGHSFGSALANDSEGFIYAVGAFEGVLEFDDTVLTSAGGKDGYLFKLDTLGNLLWSKQFKSFGDVHITSLTVDHENNILVLGDYRSKVNFDTQLTTNNTDTLYSSNMFIAKYSPSGDMEWAKNTGGVAHSGNSLTIDSDNEILISGRSVDVQFFDTTTYVTTLDSILQMSQSGEYYWYYFHPKVGFLAKYTAGGEKIWVKKAGGNAENIIVDSGDNIIVTGFFMGDTYFDNVLIPKIGFITSFLAQYDTNGDLNWVKTSGGSSGDNSGYGLAVDTLGNIYQSGQISGNDIEFDGNVIMPFAGVDAFVAKYDGGGNLIWYKLIGSPTTMTGESNFNSGNSLKIDGSGDIWMVGYFMDDLTFSGVNLQSYGAPDLMLLKFNPEGNVTAASQLTSFGWVSGTDLTIDANDRMYVTGFTSLESWNSNDPEYIFIGKINQDLTTGIFDSVDYSDAFNVMIYPNPASGKVHIELPYVSIQKKIEVYTLDGRKIKELSAQDSEIEFEIKNSGVYLVLITTGDRTVVEKIVIE